MSESEIARQIFFITKKDSTPETADAEASAGGLVERVIAGNKDAFDELYRKYSPMVHGIVLARASRDEADDIVQEVFITVFRKLHTLNDPDSFGGWIASIARRRVTDHHRSARPEDGITEDIPVKRRPVTEAREVLEIIRSLPDAYTETLILRLVEGMTGPEIAESTGLTPASVRVNLHRGMKMLREKLGTGD